ncbi:PH domain-containing protein [Mollicutes bacterium LVI A0039]|nr:PH domain-containing protein [Mollicutes bacterium LVI A0039]
MKKRYFFLKLGIGLLVNIIITTVALLTALNFKLFSSQITMLIIVINILITILSTFIKYAQFKKYVPNLYASYITLNEGVLFQKYKYIPTVNVQSIKHKRGIVQRMCKLNTLILSTSGEDVKLTYLLNEQVAEFIAIKIEQRGDEYEA